MASIHPFCQLFEGPTMKEMFVLTLFLTTEMEADRTEFSEQSSQL